MTSLGRTLDFYLSEMAITDGHGGGLTLQRVLGADVFGIQHCFHVARFAQHVPPIAALAGRSVALWSVLEDDIPRAAFGSRPLGWLHDRMPVRRLHALRTARLCRGRLSACAEPIGLVCPQGLPSLLATRELRRLRNIRYVTWVMDDHLVRWREGRLSYPRNIRALMHEHLSEASAVMVISPAMRDFYRVEFGVDADVLFGPASDVPTSPRQARASASGLRLGYFGAMTIWQLDALIALARCLPKAAATLDIYSAAALPPALNVPGVRLLKSIASSDVSATMSEYDAVVLPIGFLEDVRNLTMLNIATKMSECLASSTVTLAIGPPYAAMMTYLSQYGAAFCVQSPDAQAIQTALADLVEPGRRSAVLDAAAKLVRGELSGAAMHAKWRAVWERACRARSELEITRG